MRIIAASVLLVIAVSPLQSADATFRHAEGFTILVPDGWQQDNQASGVAVSKGPASLSVIVFPAESAPESLISTAALQVAKQWRSFEEVKHTQCMVAGISGACSWYYGVNPKGEAINLKIGATIQRGNGYLVFVESPQQNPTRFTADLNRIEQSLSLARGPSAPAPKATLQVDPKRLAALDKAYQDGKMSTEEYELRKQQLQSGDTPVSEPLVRAKQPAVSHTSPQTPPSFNDLGAQRFQSPDGLFATSVPQGWTIVPAGGVVSGASFFAPLNGGLERIMVGSGPLYISNAQQLVLTAVATLGRAYPGLRLAGPPNYFKRRGLTAAQFNLQGRAANGASARCWYSLVMAGNRYFYVFSMAFPASASRVEQDAQTMFEHFEFQQSHP